VTAPTTLGSYRLIAELGHGGMADVFLAVVEGPAGSGFTKLAVIKKLRENLAEDPDFVAMLMDEARITARLSHPNVVQLFEVGQQNETYFLAIEYLEGQPLHRIGRRAKREQLDVPSELYYTIVSEVLAGLHHAHELADYNGTPLQVVHRDVTPHNVFVTYDGAVKVVDFGIAKAMGRATETQQGVVKGKVPYMSPEQVTGGHVDRRTDIFAVGVILWNAATGSKLWANLDEFGIVRALCTGRYEASPRAVCPDVPDAIDAICRKALAFRPEDRYETAAEMRADLEAFLGQASIGARKRLESTMKHLFAPERAKLRAVLEAASLTSVASVNAFTAGATGDEPTTVDRRLLRESDPPPGGDERTELMPNAPLRPAPPPRKEQPSIAAMSLPPVPSARTAENAPPKVKRKRRPKPEEPSGSRIGLAVAVGAAVAVLGLGVLIAAGGRPTDEAAAHEGPRGGHAAVAEVTSFSKTPRPKVERRDSSNVTPAVPGRGSPAVARRPGTNDHGTTPPERPAPSPEADPSGTAHAKTTPPPKGSSSPGKLDDTDPWRNPNR
jgi:serine/threonine protein kinase